MVVNFVKADMDHGQLSDSDELGRHLRHFRGLKARKSMWIWKCLKRTTPKRMRVCAPTMVGFCFATPNFSAAIWARRSWEEPRTVCFSEPWCDMLRFTPRGMEESWLLVVPIRSCREPWSITNRSDHLGSTTAIRVFMYHVVLDKNHTPKTKKVQHPSISQRSGLTSYDQLQKPKDKSFQKSSWC